MARPPRKKRSIATTVERKTSKSRTRKKSTDAMLEIDTLEQSVYPMPSDAPKEEYGGIIRYVPVREYIVSDKYGNPDTDLDKIKLLAEEIDKAEW